MAPAGDRSIKYDPDTDEIGRLAKGDPVAARKLVARYSDRLMAVAWRMTGARDAAEDIVQEAFIRMIRQAPDWEPGRARFSTWLHRVTVNLCYDRLRKASTRNEWAAGDDLPDAADDAAGADEVMEGAERVSAVRAALDRLPERQRMAVVLCLYEELSNREAAQAMEVSVEALESLLSRARRTLKADPQLAADLGEDRELTLLSENRQ